MMDLKAQSDRIQLFHACLVNSQNYAMRYRGQLNALLPDTRMHRLRMSLNYSPVNSFNYTMPVTSSTTHVTELFTGQQF